MSNRDLCIMACIFCREPKFQQWISSLDGGTDKIDENGAKAFIVTICGVKSRNDLDTNQEAAQKFHDLVRIPYLEFKENV